MTNAAGDVGILIDGERLDPINDEAYVGNGIGDLHFDVGYIELATAAGNHNWVIGFGTDRAPTYLDAPWSTGTDVLNMTLDTPIGVPLAIWIIQGPYDDQMLHAADAVATTAAIWQAERAGFEISSVEYHDATADPDITADILDSTGGDNRNWDDFSNLIGITNDRINIYWIDTVESSATTGWSDFGNRIVMGRNTGDELLVHEIGHALSLQHPSGCFVPVPEFDATNVMWQCSNIREFLSEGQIFRAHFDAASATNAILAARPGQPQPNCPDLTGNNVCPTLERRLWSDGTFPPN